MIVPKQLQNCDIRFCKVVRNGKRAFEKEFNKPNMAYKWNSLSLHQWLFEKDGNFGVLCGYANLFVLDFDDEKTYRKVKKILPPTFTVRSGGKNLPHLYYISTDSDVPTTIRYDDERRYFKNANFLDCDIIRDNNIITAKGNAFTEFAIETGKIMGVFKNKQDEIDTLNWLRNVKQRKE